MTTNVKNKIALTALVILGGTLSAPAATTPNQVDFKIIHQPGKITRYKLVTKVVGDMKMPDPMPEQKTSQIMEYEYRSKCLKVSPDGSAVYEMSTPRVDARMDFGGFKSHLSSEPIATRPASTPATQSNQLQKSEFTSKIFSAMTKAKFTVTIDKYGTPIKLEGYKESMNKALQNLGKLDANEQMMANLFRQSMNDEFMLKEMKSRYTIFPHRTTVRIGDTWTAYWEMSMPIFNMTTQNTVECKVIAIETFRSRPCLKIQTRESMKFLPKPKPAAFQPGNPFSNMDFKMTAGKGSGQAYLDYRTGEVVQLHRIQRMETQVTLKTPPGQTAAQDSKPIQVRQSALTSTSLDLIDPAPPAKK